jgi:hypothetical protein
MREKNEVTMNIYESSLQCPVLEQPITSHPTKGQRSLPTMTVLNKLGFAFIVSILLQVAQVNALLFQKASKAPAQLSKLDTLIQESNPSDADAQMEIKSLMMSISESRKGDQRKNLPGKWELIFTTEKEVNFFKTSWPFAQVSSIIQDLDLYDSQTIDNCINFEGGGQFAVKGTAKAVVGSSDYDRVEFEFTGSSILAWDKTIELPPVGAGWFDTMYCDKSYRLSQDVRGDWSVFRRP